MENSKNQDEAEAVVPEVIEIPREHDFYGYCMNESGQEINEAQAKLIWAVQDGMTKAYRDGYKKGFSDAIKRETISCDKA